MGPKLLIYKLHLGFQLISSFLSFSRTSRLFRAPALPRSAQLAPPPPLPHPFPFLRAAARLPNPAYALPRFFPPAPLGLGAVIPILVDELRLESLCAAAPFLCSFCRPSALPAAWRGIVRPRPRGTGKRAWPGCPRCSDLAHGKGAWAHGCFKA